MKNLPALTILALGAISLTATPVVAAGAVMYREVKSNNLFGCSTNQQIEHIWTGGNSTSYGSTHTLICLDGDRKAKWVMTSTITCQSRNIKLKECPTWFNNEHTQNEPNQFPIKGSFFVNPANADPCADYKLNLDRGYVYNCGQQYRKMIVDDPTGTPLNVRDSPNGSINRTLNNGTVIWTNITRSNKEFGYDSQ